MPCHWLPADPCEESPPSARLHLHPHQSLGRQGFGWFIAGTAALIVMPLLAVLATPVFWGLLPFILITLSAIWFALRRSSRDLCFHEELTITQDLAKLRRIGPGGRRQEWQANSFWVQVTLYPEGGPVANYLTLKGGGREVEIGAFLTPEERAALAPALRQALLEARPPAGS